MKGIIIKDANRDRIEAEIKKVQAKCKERLIDYDIIVRMVAEVERTLDIPKCRLKGVTVDCDWNAQEFANAYHGTPESTQFYAEYTGTVWKLLDVSRCACRRSKSQHIVKLTDDAKAAIIERMERF